MADEVWEAVGGVHGGQSEDTGQRVVVRLAGPCLDVFHETGSHRFHLDLVDSIELAEHPSSVGTSLEVQATRQGIGIPVRFEDVERDRLEEIIRRVRAYRGGS